MARQATQDQHEITDEERKSLDSMVATATAAATAFRNFSQEQVDEIVRAMAIAGLKANTRLAALAVEETGIGILEDKVLKNYVATEFLYDYLRDKKTVGVIERDQQRSVDLVAEPIGVVLAILPLTNPTATALFKAIVAAKTRNAMIVRPSSRATRCVGEAIDVIVKAGEAAGMPKGAIQCDTSPSRAGTQYLFREDEVDFVWTTGGQQIVHAANASGKPTIGVGPGNAPVYIHKSANVPMAVVDMLVSNTFDASVICPAEQTAVIDAEVWDETLAEMERMNARVLTADEADRVTGICFDRDTGATNYFAIGRSAFEIAAAAEVDVDPDCKVLVCKVDKVDEAELLVHEKLFPVLAVVRVDSSEAGIQACEDVIEIEGMGHTSAIYGRDQAVIDEFARRIRTGRILVNVPTAFGALGGLYTDLPPTMSLGCGTWGGSNTTDNVNYKNLLNIKQVSYRKTPPMWFRSPVDIYFNEHAIDNLRQQRATNVVLITSPGNVRRGLAEKVAEQLPDARMHIFAEIPVEPTDHDIDRGVAFLREAQPDLIVAAGGGSILDAAKMMRLQYQCPDLDWRELALPFLDVRKRIAQLPDAKNELRLVAIPTTSGTGADVSPAAVVTDSKTGRKVTVIDYALVPDVAIVDPQFVWSMPPNVAADSGVDALTHAMEALVSIFSSPYTEALCFQAINLLLRNLPQSVADPEDHVARAQVHNAATIAGLAFANASVGVCHALAHAFGARFGVSHGRSCGLFLPHVIAYNAGTPRKFMPAPGYSAYVAPEAYGRVARVTNLAAEETHVEAEGGREPDAASLNHTVCRLLDAVGIERSIEDLGIGHDEFHAALADLVNAAMDDMAIRTNPRQPQLVEIKELFEQAWAGRGALVEA